MGSVMWSAWYDDQPCVMSHSPPSHVPMCDEPLIYHIGGSLPITWWSHAHVVSHVVSHSLTHLPCGRQLPRHLVVL